MSSHDSADGWDLSPLSNNDDQSANGGAGHDGPAELSENDQRMLDALVECGFDLDDLEDCTEAERKRAGVLLGVFRLLHDYPVDDADETLIHATMARIDRCEDGRSKRLSLTAATEEEPPAKRGAFSFRMPDFIAVAAAILLVASVVLPVLHSIRQRSIDAQCANNLRVVGYGFGQYAADNHGEMPVTRMGVLGGTWDTFSNAINLKPLLEGHYCSHGHFRCPGNHNNLEMAYSYQWQRSGERMMWGGARISIAMGDRNPIMDAARAGRIVPVLTMSPDHSGRGQNVLATDGATLWLGDEPIVGGVGGSDNIWLPHGARQLMPGAEPRDFWDVFLAH